MCRWTLPSYYPRAFIDHLRSTWNKQMKQGEGWHVHSKRTIYTLKPFNIPHQPTWKMINNTWRKNLKKHFFLSMWEWEFILMYKIHCHFSTRLENHKKKTIKTMYAFCYTERHSVWYVVYYCKHILTDICYRVERKRSTLSSNGNPFMYIFNTSCGAKGLCHWSEENHCFRIV